MKKFFTALAIMLAIAVVSPVFAQVEGTADKNREKPQKQRSERPGRAERPERQKRDRGEKMAKEANAEQMLANIEERKTRVLENIAKRYTKLNERFAEFGEKINKASTRMERLQNYGLKFAQDLALRCGQAPPDVLRRAKTF